MNFFHYEIPPTAGLPLHISDFFPKLDSFEEKLSQFIGVSTVQIECSATVALVVALSSLKKLSHKKKSNYQRIHLSMGAYCNYSLWANTCCLRF